MSVQGLPSCFFEFVDHEEMPDDDEPSITTRFAPGSLTYMRRREPPSFIEEIDDDATP